MADTSTGWGSFAKEFLIEAWEEIPKSPVLLYSVSGKERCPDLYDEDRLHRIKSLQIYNQTMSLATFTDCVDLIIPLTMNFSS